MTAFATQSGCGDTVFLSSLAAQLWHQKSDTVASNSDEDKMAVVNGNLSEAPRSSRIRKSPICLHRSLQYQNACSAARHQVRQLMLIGQVSEAAYGVQLHATYSST